jgi:hypothetical protein
LSFTDEELDFSPFEREDDGLVFGASIVVLVWWFVLFTPLVGLSNGVENSESTRGDPEHKGFSKMFRNL